MNFLEQQFLIQQKRLQTRKGGRGVKGRQYVAPLFSADVLTGFDEVENDQRLISYLRKRAGMKLPTITEAVSSVRVRRAPMMPVGVKEKAA